MKIYDKKLFLDKNDIEDLNNIEEFNENSSILWNKKEFNLLYSKSEIKTNNKNYIVAADRNGKVYIIKVRVYNGKKYYRELKEI